MMQWVLKASCRRPYEESELLIGFLIFLQGFVSKWKFLRTVNCFVSSNKIKLQTDSEFMLKFPTLSGELVYLAVIEK